MALNCQMWNAMALKFTPKGKRPRYS